MNKYIKKYNDFIINHSGMITALEDLIKATTIFIPGRFSSEEIRGESVYTIVNIISLYHDRILERYNSNRTAEIHCKKETNVTRSLKVILSILKHSQVLLEMISMRILAKKTPKTNNIISFIMRTKWGSILLIEVIRMIILLYIFKHNKYRMSLRYDADKQAAQYVKEKMLQKVNENNNNVDDNKDDKYPEVRTMYEVHGRGSLHPNPSVPRRSTPHPHGCFSILTNPVETTLLHDKQSQPTLKSMLSELLHVIRPVVFVVCVIKMRSSNSWSPFILSLLCDIGSTALAGELNKLTDVEQREMRRRFSLLFFYLVRSPFYERFTRPPLLRIVALLSRIPLLGFIFSNISELLMWLPTYYFYTSASG